MLKKKKPTHIKAKERDSRKQIHKEMRKLLFITAGHGWLELELGALPLLMFARFLMSWVSLLLAIGYLMPFKLKVKSVLQVCGEVV